MPGQTDVNLRIQLVVLSWCSGFVFFLNQVYLPWTYFNTDVGGRGRYSELTSSYTHTRLPVPQQSHRDIGLFMQVGQEQHAVFLPFSLFDV